MSQLGRCSANCFAAHCSAHPQEPRRLAISGSESQEVHGGQPCVLAGGHKHNGRPSVCRMADDRRVCWPRHCLHGQSQCYCLACVHFTLVLSSHPACGLCLQENKLLHTCTPLHSTCRAACRPCSRQACRHVHEHRKNPVWLEGSKTNIPACGTRSWRCRSPAHGCPAVLASRLRCVSQCLLATAACHTRMLQIRP